MRSRQTSEENKQNILSDKQKVKSIESSKSSISGLNNIPVTNFDKDTNGLGIFGVGLLNKLPPNIDGHDLDSSGLYKMSNISMYEYFFIQYDNQNKTINKAVLKVFGIIKTINKLRESDVAKMLGIDINLIKGLTYEQYINDSFNHPVYKNTMNTSMQIRYAELLIAIQKTPGRLDDIISQNPSFDTTPDGIITRI